MWKEVVNSTADWVDIQLNRIPEELFIVLAVGGFLAVVIIVIFSVIRGFVS